MKKTIKLDRRAVFAAALGLGLFAAYQEPVSFGQSVYSVQPYNYGTVANTEYASVTPIVEYADEAQGVATTDATDAGQLINTGDPIRDFQAQLEALQKKTEKLQLDFESEKKKNEKKEKFNLPFNTKIGGQLRVDGVYVSENDEAKSNFGDVENSLGVRDLRVTFGGSSYGNLQYAVAFCVNNTITFQDVWLRAKDTGFGTLTVGNFYVESGMESLETNWDRVYAMTDEGAAMFRLGRRLGFSTQLYGAEKQSRAFFAIFTPQNLATSPHRINHLDNLGVILNTRLTAAPILIDDEDGYTREVFHVGGSYFWLHPATGGKLNLQTTGLGWAGTEPKFLSGSVALDGKSYSLSTVEAAYQHEGFATTAEGYFCSIEDGGDAYGTTIATRWLLTPGVTRRYNRDEGRFGMVKMPDEQVFLDVSRREIGRNFGALEALAKWEWVEANNLKEVKGATYGQVHRVVAGANWFWNEQVFWTFNWEHAFVNAHKADAPVKGEFDTLILQGSLKF